MRGGRWQHTYAAIDLGTNNCRLLVARPTDNGFRVIDAFSRIVRLGEGVSATRVLSAAAMERTIAALKICAAKMSRRGVTRARNIATAACRQATNCEEFVHRVLCETGLPIDIITSGEEAELAVAACSPLIDRATEYALVFDIGGGSTELMWLRVGDGGGTEVMAWTSLPCGVVTLAEDYGGRDVTAEIYQAMIDDVSRFLLPFEGQHAMRQRMNGRATQMLGTSGTVTTLAGVHLGLRRYDRSLVDGLRLRFDQAFRVSRQLQAMTYEERVGHPCIGSERADLVVAGCAILEAICNVWPVGNVRVADRGLREGVLLSLMRAADSESGNPAQDS